jgi:nucleotide-binding universal stress UspA family protein
MENKNKKVLIALDYNPTAQKIAEEGFALAQAMNAEIILLHVIADPVYYSSTEYSPIMGFTGYADMGQLQPINESLKKSSQHFLNKTKHHLGDESIKTLVGEGDFAETILKTAEDIHANIIVIGSHSRRWLEEVLMGSVTEKILHESTVPLFIIPTKKSKNYAGG